MAAKTRSKSKQDVLAALSDVVTVSPPADQSRFPAGHESYSSASYSGQAPMMTSEATPSVPTKDSFDPMGAGRSRSNKDQPPAPPAKGMSKFSQAFKRHTPEEKEAKRREKEKRMHKAIDDSTMKSSRMDIIDRLDASGIHGNSLFHHDSPYDACSPHSNRNSRRAPVMAFDHTIDPMTGQPIGMRATKQPNLSPLAAATMRKMDDQESMGGEDLHHRANFSGPIPTLRMDSTDSANTLSARDDGSSLASHSTIDRDVDAERAYRQNNYYNKPVKGSKARQDVANPHADIWGVSSEPWQDFASPAGSSGGLRPRDSRGTNGRKSNESGSGTASAASSVFDMEAVMTGKKPQPSPRASDGPSSGLSPDAANSSGPKRSKSLIKKIRTARQNPNVPPPSDDLELSSLNINDGNSTGRVRAASGSTATRRPGHGYSPSTPPTLTQRGVSSPNVRSDAGLGRSGTLKAGENGGENGGGYYRRNDAGGNASADSSPQGATGLGRNGSIFGRFLGKGRERGEVSAR